MSNTIGIDPRYQGVGLDLDAQSVQLGLRAAGKIFGIGCQNSRPTFEQDDMGVLRTNGPELVGEGMVGNFGDRAGKLDAGRASRQQ